MSFNYASMTTAQHAQAVKAELGHREQLQQAAAMWQGFASWLGLAEAQLEDRRKDLFTGWNDGAHTEVDARLARCRNALGAWVAQINASGVVRHLTNLSNLIGTISGKVEWCDQRWKWALKGYRYPGLSKLHGPALEAELVMAHRDSVNHMNALAQAYADAAAAMSSAVKDLSWPGPRGGTAEPGSAGTSGTPGQAGGPSLSPADPASSPDLASATAPAQTTPAPATSAGPTDATDDADSAAEALSALSRLAQSLAGSAPSPITAPIPDPARLGGVIDLAPSTGRDLGLAGLSGGGSIGDGVSATVAETVSRATNPAAGSTPAATPSPAASATGAGGYPPPMYPPHAGGVKGAGGAGGVKPGTADQPVPGRPRDRSSTALPGVALRGRRTGTQPATPAVQRRWDDEETTIRLLDEELWQVNHHGVADGRTPRKGT